MKTWPIRRRFSCGSTTPFKAFEKSLGRVDHPQLGARCASRTPRRPTSRSPSRSSPVSTNTQTTRGPSALARRAAQTAESTPPDSPQTTRSSGPTRRLISDSERSMNASIVQVRGLPADPVQEVAQDQRAVRRVRDLGMKLEAVDRQLAMPHRRDRAGRGRGQRQEIAAGVVDLVAVAHPDDRLARDVVEERLGRVQHAALGAAELAGRRRIDLGPHRLAGQLHPVADPQDRHAQLEDRRIALRCPGLVDARRPAREDQGQRVQLANSLGRDVVADDPRKRMPLAHPARDELDVLSTEIQDQYGTCRRVGIRHELLSWKDEETSRLRRNVPIDFVHQVYQKRPGLHNSANSRASPRDRQISTISMAQKV